MYLDILNEYFNVLVQNCQVHAFLVVKEYLITHANFSRHTIYLRLSWVFVLD